MSQLQVHVNSGPSPAFSSYAIGGVMYTSSGYAYPPLAAAHLPPATVHLPLRHGYHQLQGSQPTGYSQPGYSQHQPMIYPQQAYGRPQAEYPQVYGQGAVVTQPHNREQPGQKRERDQYNDYVDCCAESDCCCFCCYCCDCD